MKQYILNLIKEGFSDAYIESVTYAKYNYKYSLTQISTMVNELN